MLILTAAVFTLRELPKVLPEHLSIMNIQNNIETITHPCGTPGVLNINE